MASTNLGASTPVICEGPTEVKSALDALSLSSTTDFVFVTPINGRTNSYLVYKVEREA